MKYDYLFGDNSVLKKYYFLINRSFLHSDLILEDINYICKIE